MLLASSARHGQPRQGSALSCLELQSLFFKEISKKCLRNCKEFQIESSKAHEETCISMDETRVGHAGPAHPGLWECEPASFGGDKNEGHESRVRNKTRYFFAPSIRHAKKSIMIFIILNAFGMCRRLPATHWSLLVTQRCNMTREERP